jgi:UDP-N-acetylmuramoyl-tripeptide--D-alanyl-D-alanine ligase
MENGKRETGNGKPGRVSILSQFNSADVAACTGGVLAGNGNMSFSGVSIDTRTLHAGNLFFAIRGPRHDGHSFISNALSNGASGIVVESDYFHPEDFPADKSFIRVADTHQALKDLACAVRQRWPGTPVGITGSMGKTTVKEFVTQMLQGDCSVYRSPGNYNNLYGLPLAVCALSGDDSVGIFEMGMSAPGEIAQMCRIAAPTIGIITNIAPVHLEFFNSLEEIARAKGELAETLPSDGTLIYNGDDPLVRSIAARFGGGKISFGTSAGTDICADHIEIVGPGETRFRLSYGYTNRLVKIPLAGTHFVMNALPAVALGNLYNLSPDQIADRLSRMKQASMRGQVLQFKEGFTVVDDSYNSNPQALKGMIEVLSRLPSFDRRLLVAGEMLELGHTSESLHYECGIFAANAHLDGIFGVQGAAREIVRAALSAGYTDRQARFFEDADEASTFITNEIRKGDLILVKGSRGVHTEKIVQTLHSQFECS